MFQQSATSSPQLFLWKYCSVTAYLQFRILSTEICNILKKMLLHNCILTIPHNFFYISRQPLKLRNFRVTLLQFFHQIFFFSSSIPVVLSQLLCCSTLVSSCRRCPFFAVMSWPSCTLCLVQTDLRGWSFKADLSGRPVLADMSRLPWTLCPTLSCNGFPAAVLPSQLYCTRFRKQLVGT